MNDVYDFLKRAEVFYLATIDGEQPRVRVFGAVNIFEERLYLLSGKWKDVVKQIELNPRVELCTMKDGEWLRVSAVLVRDDRVEAQESMLDAYPSMRGMYTSGDEGNTVVYYLKDAKAVISSFTKDPVVIEF